MASRSFLEEYAEKEFGDPAWEVSDPDTPPKTAPAGQQSKSALPQRDPRLASAASEVPSPTPKRQRFSWSDHADEAVLAGIRATALREAAAKQSQGGSSSSGGIAGAAAPSGLSPAVPGGTQFCRGART